MICNKCGKEIEEKWKFCNYCGNNLEKDVEENTDKLKKLYKIIAIITSIIMVLKMIISYFVEIDIINQIEYGNVYDFFKILCNTIGRGIVGVISGLAFAIVITVGIKICEFIIKNIYKVIKKNKINILIIVAIITIVIASIFVYKAFDVKENYYNSDTYTSFSKNAYVGGDAYNYIINANYFTGYLTFAGCLYIISCILIVFVINTYMKKEKYNSKANM